MTLPTAVFSRRERVNDPWPQSWKMMKARIVKTAMTSEESTPRAQDTAIARSVRIQPAASPVTVVASCTGLRQVDRWNSLSTSRSTMTLIGTPQNASYLSAVISPIMAEGSRPKQDARVTVRRAGQKGTRAVPAIAHRRRPVPAHDLAAHGDRRREHPRLRRGDPGGQPPVGDRLGLPAADGRPTGHLLGLGQVLHRLRPGGPAAGRVPEGHQPVADGHRTAPVRAGHPGGRAGPTARGEAVRDLPRGDQVAGRAAVPGPAGGRLARAEVGAAGHPGRAVGDQAGAAAGFYAAAARTRRGHDRQADPDRAGTRG